VYKDVKTENKKYLPLPVADLPDKRQAGAAGGENSKRENGIIEIRN
jgi:hypothetical protein